MAFPTFSSVCLCKPSVSWDFGIRKDKVLCYLQLFANLEHVLVRRKKTELETHRFMFLHDAAITFL